MSESEDSNFTDGGWIEWFCSLEEHGFFCEVEDDYIRDQFNLYGLKKYFNRYEEALEMILYPDRPDDEELEEQNFIDVYQEAIDLYGLIHARYIVTQKGLAMMREKFVANDFGTCPRVLCQSQPVLPIGMSENLKLSRVKVFCPLCEEVYVPKKKCTDVDGAYFGCSFPHIFLQTYPDLAPKNPPNIFVPRVFGFKLYKKKGSKYHEPKKGMDLTYFGEDKEKERKLAEQEKLKHAEKTQATKAIRDSDSEDVSDQEK